MATKRSEGPSYPKVESRIQNDHSVLDWAYSCYRKPSSPYAYDSSNTKRSSELRQKKMVTWPNEPIDNSRSVGAVQETRVSGNFCRILQKYAADDRSCLNLLVKNESLYLQTASVTPNDEHKQEFISLGDFLTSQSKSSSTAVKKKDKLILMVILANGFLHFHQGPWFTREWSKTNILFSIYESHKTPNLARPYLSTQCTSQDDSSESKEPDEIEASLIAHPYPCILALGILFLEIRLGKTIESWRSEYYSDNEVTASWISKISTANEMLDQCIGDTSQDFENAISACLKTDQFSDYHRQRMTLDNSSEFREKIYLDIVQRLENELKDATGCLVEQLDALPSPDKLSLKRALPQQYMSANPSDIKGVAVQGVTSTSVSATGLNEALSITSNCEVCLYDDTDGPGETDKGE